MGDDRRPSVRGKLILDNPANSGILAYLGSAGRLARSVSSVRDRASCPPGDVEDPYYTLGAHPDLVELLWERLNGALPADCRWVVFGTPSLVHPRSGVIFGFCGGTHTCALRLPPAMVAAAVAQGASRTYSYPGYPALGIEETVLDLSTIGAGWIFTGWNRKGPEWCLVAFQEAGQVP